MIHFFQTSDALREYVRQNDVITWHGDYGLGLLSMIDTSSLHVVFDSQCDYECWDAAGRPVQMSLF